MEQAEPETLRSASFNVQEDGRVKFRWASSDFKPETPALDKPALAYYVGAEFGDPLARLAFAHYVSNGLTLGPTEGQWWQATLLAGTTPAAPPGIAQIRAPRLTESQTKKLARCQQALKLLAPVAEEAAFNEDHAMDSASDLNFLVTNAEEAVRAKKELADWIAIRAHDVQQPDQIAQAAYHLHGDSDVGLRRNESKARELYDEVAAKGNVEAAWSALLLHARSGNLALLERSTGQILASPSAPQVRIFVARHYVYRHGFGVERNAARAGAYLLLAADQGDANAQQTIAHGYAGVACAELEGVQVAGSPNDRRALHYYMLAAQQGRPVSAVNAATLLAQQGGNSDPLQTCQATVRTFRNVALAYHPEVLRMHAHARRAFHLGDMSGALLRFQLLSELGAKNSHENAAAMWARRRHEDEDFEALCWRSSASLGGRTCEVEYLHRAASLSGTVDAMVKLSAAYDEANDEAAAFHWASRAAATGDSHSLYTTAYHKRHGLGTPQDLPGACDDYCQLWNRSNDSALPRVLALAQAAHIQWSLKATCCDSLPSSQSYFMIAAAGAAVIFSASAALMTTCMS